MKTKTAFLFFAALFFSLKSTAQTFNIIGPSEVCVGDCEVYYLVDDAGNIVTDIDGYWGVNGSTISEENSASVCFGDEGDHFIYIIDWNNNIVAEFTVQAYFSFEPEIITLSGAYCPADSVGGSVGCDQLCANTTITYTTEITDPNQEVVWTVLGSETYTANGNNLSVTWTEPGSGAVFAEVSPPQDGFLISCGMSLGESPGGQGGTGFVYIDGPSDSYDIELVGPNGYLSTIASSGGINIFDGLEAGTYTATVANSLGVVEVCSFEITITDIPCNLGVALDVDNATDCQTCDGSMTPVVIGGSAPFTYLWATGNTTDVITDLCPGTYTVTVVDSNGCTATAIGEVNCSTGSCWGQTSICVDILENPEAAFETTPPAVNGVVEVCEGQTVFFENLTTGAANFTWDFGNSTSSSEVDAEYTFLTAGTYEVMLIARNNCFCSDTTTITVLVEDAISPEIDCAGTICPDTEVTYSTAADCSIFNWNISANGTIIDGGGIADNFITVDWGTGPEGLIELSVDGCNGDYCLATMFETIPIIDDSSIIKGPEKVCKGDEVIYSITSFTGTEFVWSASNFATIASGQGTNEITVQWASVIPANEQWIAVQYESCYLGCGGEDTLFVNILNDFFIEGPIEVCVDESVNFYSRTPDLSGNEVPANWTIYDGAGLVVSSSGATTNDFAVNWTFGSGNFEIFAEADNPADYCVDNYSIFVEVPTGTPPALGIDGATTICPGSSYTYSAIESGPGFQYTWYVSNSGSNVILNGQTINITWGASPPYNLAVTQTNTSGLACESADVGMSMQSINSVVVNGTTPVCHEQIGTYTATVYEGVSYNWQTIPADAGTVVAGENTNEVEIQWHLPGNFEVEVNVCGNVDVFNVLINPKPAPQVLFDDPCPNELTIVQTTIVYDAYEWRDEFGATIASTPTVDLGTGYYEVIVTDANGCTENETFFIGQQSNPYTTISTADFGTFCQNGGSMLLHSLQTTGGLDYQWYHNGNPIGGNTPSLSVSQEGVYYVVVTNPAGCEATSNSLGLSCGSVFPGPPVPGCTPDGYLDFEITAGNFCNESEYLNTSVNDVPNTWFWKFIDFGAGIEEYSNLESPTHTFQTAGFHLVIYQAGVFSSPPGDTCFGYTSQFDTVPLAANFTFLSGCVDEVLPFYDNSSFIPQTSIAGWEWDFGDPSSGAANNSMLQNPTHVYSAGGIYTVTLTVTDQSGCISVRQKYLEVIEPTLSSFNIPAIGCEGTTVFFDAQGTFTDVSWNFGDPGSGAANVSEIAETFHQFETPGIYTVTLTTENIYGCITTVTEQINIEENMLSGNIDIVPASTICEGDSAILTAPLADAYLWALGDTTASITVFEAGIYEVTIYDVMGCSYSPTPAQVDVIPLPEAQITAIEYDEFGQPVNYFYNNYETCYGEDVYLEITENINYTYEWSTTDMSTSISYTEEKDNLLAVGTHDFTVTVTDATTGCSNVIGPYTVTVHPVPENIQITSTPATPICENTPTLFEVVNPDASYTYIWNTGEIGLSINSFYAGEYFVRAINQFGCEGTSNTLEINAGPNIDLIPSGCHSRCNPDTICLPDVPGAVAFQWYFNGNPVPAPDGTVGDFVAEVSGDYYVEMTNAAGCVTTSDELSLDLYDGFGSIFGNVYFDINDNGIIDGPDTLMSGISIILQNGGTNLDTLDSNLSGAFVFSNISAEDYEVVVDLLNLPVGMIAVVEQISSQIEGCDDEENVEFLIQFDCDATIETLDLSACEGTTVPYNGDDLAAGTTTNYTFTNSIGCDSIVSVVVASLSIFDENITLGACEGETVEYNNQDLLAGSTTEFMFNSVDGCDSLVTVFVEILQNSSFALNLSACENETVIYNNQELDPGSISTFNFTNAAGCDSVVTVTVIPSSLDETPMELFTCPGETIEYNNDQLSPGTEIDYTFTNEEGCDSIVQISVLAYPDFDYELLSAESCWNDSEGEISVDALAGGTVPFEYSIDGLNYQAENQFLNIAPGDYEVFVKDGNGCVNAQTITVESIPAMTVFAEEPQLPCDLQSVLLEPRVVADEQDSLAYLWSDGSTSPMLEVMLPGVYTVAITNTCETITKDFEIKFEDDDRLDFLYVPNVFSPNGDGLNDEFRVYTTDDIEVLSFELNLFDRWGNHVKGFANTEDFWDGSFDDEMMNPGVFVFYYKMTILTCGRTLDLYKEGDVTLVK